MKQNKSLRCKSAKYFLRINKFEFKFKTPQYKSKICISKFIEIRIINKIELTFHLIHIKLNQNNILTHREQKVFMDVYEQNEINKFIEPKLTINFIRLYNNFINQNVQDNQTKEDQDGKKTKRVTFCFENNIIHSIYKCSSEYFSKKKRRQLSRKISSSIKGKWLFDQTSSDEETKNNSDIEDYEHFYSIIEWKNIQEVSQQKMTSNNQNEVQNSKNINDFQNKNFYNRKPCLKQIKKQDIPSQFDQLQQQQDQIDDQQTEVCTEKKLNKNNQQIIVSKFKDCNERQEGGEEVKQLKLSQISINLDDLFDFQINYKVQKVHDPQDISIYDQLQKKIDFKSAFKIVDIVKLYENI